MKGRHIVMTLVLPVAAWLAFFGDKTPASAQPETAVPAVQRVVTRTVERTPGLKSVGIVALEPREHLIGGAHADIPAEPGLFSGQSRAPPPPPLPSKPLPPPPPSAPPLPFTYIGKMERDKVWEVYLARGDQTYIVRDHTVIDDNYRVDAIKPPTLSLTYLPLQQAQTLTIGGAD